MVTAIKKKTETAEEKEFNIIYRYSVHYLNQCDYIFNVMEKEILMFLLQYLYQQQLKIKANEVRKITRNAQTLICSAFKQYTGVETKWILIISCLYN
jgi:hypothetical protein